MYELSLSLYARLSKNRWDHAPERSDTALERKAGRFVCERSFHTSKLVAREPFEHLRSAQLLCF
jgi:hypothetical protein